MAISFVYTLLAVLGAILLIIPGVIFMVFYCFAIYAVVFEGHKFEGAFGHSRELVRGYWWAVFGRFVAGGAIVYLAYIIIGGLYTGLMSLIFKALGIAVNKESLGLMNDFLSIFAGLALGPLTMLYAYKIYKSLKEAKNI